jgi:PAS domain-containing protein
VPDAPVGETLVTRLAGAARAVAERSGTEAVKELLDRAIQPFAATGGLVLLLTDRGELRLLCESGVPPDVLERFLTLGIASGVPITDAVRFGRPVWIEAITERDARYPMIQEARGGSVSSASLPIVVGDQVVGAIGIAVATDRRFAPDERAYLEALADLCSLALGRSRSEEATRYAEEKSRWAVSTLAEQFRLVGVQRERAAEEARRRQLESIVDAMTEGVAVAAATQAADDAVRTFVIEYANPAAAEVLGADRAAVVGSSVAELFPTPAMLAATQAVFEQRAPSQLIVVAARGSRVEVTITRYDDGVVLVLRKTG